jgi:hypothetical protein
MSTEGRQLLVIVVKGHRDLESILEGFLELELPGATILDTKSMGEIVATEIPVFAGFRSLFRGGAEESYLILSVLDAEQVREAITLVEDVCGDFSGESAGIVFTLPVSEYRGPPMD